MQTAKPLCAILLNNIIEIKNTKLYLKFVLKVYDATKWIYMFTYGSTYVTEHFNVTVGRSTIAFC